MPWNLDTVHSSVEFSVRHMVIASVKGRFATFAVDANVDEANLANSSAIVRIDATSIDTREGQRDTHLRSADFLDVENHPQISFTSRKIEPRGGADYRIVGDLTIRGVTREVTLDGEVNGPVKDPWGGTRIGLSAQGKVNRKDWGLTYNAVLEAGGFVVGDEVKLSIDLELVKGA
jgi:polyisoprenoid-binding protein YceI